MPIEMPAISLAAVPSRRHRIIEFAKEAEERGFAGIYMPSLGDNMALATALAMATNKIEFGTSICPIYFRAPLDLAQHAAFIHELSNGRFKFGIGVAHAVSLTLWGDGGETAFRYPRFCIDGSQRKDDRRIAADRAGDASQEDDRVVDGNRRRHGLRGMDRAPIWRFPWPRCRWKSGTIRISLSAI